MKYRDIPPLEFTEDENFNVERYIGQIEANIAKEEMTPGEKML